MCDEAGVFLGYSDLYGNTCSINDIKTLLNRFSVEDWLCQLARLTCLLGGNRSRTPEWAKTFLLWFTPPDMHDKVRTFLDEHEQRGITVSMPSERHVEILLELAVVYAPHTAATPMKFPGDERTLFEALLMVATLDSEYPNLELDEDALLRTLFTIWHKSMCVEPLETASYGYHTYEILRGDNRSKDAEEWASLFLKATGQKLDMYYAGGFGALTILLSHSADDLASGWQSVLNPAELKQHPRLQRSVAAYTAIRACSLNQLRTDIRSLEPFDRVSDFNLIALRKHPLMFHRGGVYPLSLSGISSSLFEGVYQAIVTVANTANERKHVGGVFGRLFETYILSLLREKFSDRLLSNPKRRDNGEEAADAVLLCEGGILVFQIKGTRISGKQKPIQLTTQTLEEYFDRTGLLKAGKQLEQSISLCRRRHTDGQPLVEGLLDYWVESIIQPVILTYERIAEVSLTKPIIAKRMPSLGHHGPVRPPIILSVSDVENAVSLPQETSLWQVLNDYTASRTASPLHNYLGNKRHADPAIIARRRETMIDALVSYLDLPNNGDAD